jgi:hypothetical protein
MTTSGRVRLDLAPATVVSSAVSQAQIRRRRPMSVPSPAPVPASCCRSHPRLPKHLSSPRPASKSEVCNGFDSKGLCYATRALTANDFVIKRTSGRRRFQSCPFCRAYRAEYASRDRSGSGSRPPPVPAGLRRRCDLCDPKNDDEREPVYKGLPCNTVRPCGIACPTSAASMLTWRASPSSSAPRPAVGRTTCRSRRLARPSSLGPFHQHGLAKPGDGGTPATGRRAQPRALPPVGARPRW